ncbi:MAG TPA: DUF5985 family protein [Candidatus Acidoferrales bacterium]|jgi:hypothetical protein|nr:DUF5985 family protein [Candidatus Acidoferrales bacterium]
MASIVYILGSLTSLICAVFLLRGYNQGRSQLLLWSGLCFSGLALSNLLVFIDLILLPNVDLYLARLTVTAISMFLLLFGLVWES